MDELDSLILQKLQNDFPLTERPYGTIASQLDITIDQPVLHHNCEVVEVENAIIIHVAGKKIPAIFTFIFLQAKTMLPAC